MFIKKLVHWLKNFIVALTVTFTFLLLASPSFAGPAEPSTVVSKVVTDEKLIALTFDSGSDVGILYRILDILDLYNIKCTFFLTGKFAKSHPGAANLITQKGHEIGNHSYDHPRFTGISAASMKDQLWKMEMAIQSATGRLPAKLFRPPYGSYNSAVLLAVGEAGYKHTIMWSIDSIDWKGVPAAEIQQRVLQNAAPGAIVLMHVGGGTHTLGALPGIIDTLKSRGFSFVTVSSLLAQTAPPAPSLYYTVKPGDTLWKISRMYNTTATTLVRLNNITNPDLIFPGQVLKVKEAGTSPTPLPQTYTVQPGDTLWKISRTYSTSVDKLVHLNSIKNPDLIYPGQVLTRLR